MGIDIFFWLLFGALIGALAAQKRGFSMVAGVLGGMLLGPLLALLMFFVSGDRTKCPHCAELIKKEAKLCPHCRSDLTEGQAEGGPQSV